MAKKINETAGNKNEIIFKKEENGILNQDYWLQPKKQRN